MAVQDVPAGQEILISYLGSDPKKSNIQLMKDYGFVLPGNTNDRLNLRPTGRYKSLLASCEQTFASLG